jgi:hypothetical protein
VWCTIPRFAGTLCAIAALAGGCASSQDTLHQQQEKLESLGATTQMIGESWLTGQLSATYARTALEETQRQVEEQRTVVAGTPAMLQEPHGADLSERGERLSRLLAQLLQDVDTSDSGAARHHLSQIPIVPESR